MSAVAVHGWAFHTPLGSDPKLVLGRLLAGERAAAPCPLFDAQSHPCVLAAAIPQPPLPSRRRKFLGRMGLYAVEVGALALEHARQRVPQLLTLPSARLGLFFGYGGLRAPWDELMGAMAEQASDLGLSWERGLRQLHPFFMLQQLSNNAHALCAEEVRAQGEGVTLAGPNAGAQALASASAALAAGAVDAALCVAYDSLIAPEVLIEQGLRGSLTRARTAAELRAPYDRAAAGAVPGEAAAALLLMSDAAAEPLAWVRAADGRHAARQVRSAAQVIDGAAQAVVAADEEELRALAAGTLLTATLGSFGQVGAAAPLVQTIAVATALRAGKLPPIAGLAAEQAVCKAAVTAATGTSARAALCLSVGGAVAVEIGGASHV